MSKVLNIDSSAEFTEIIIPTIDSTKYNWIERLLLSKKKNLIIVGPTGTGKTANYKKLLNIIILSLTNVYYL